MSGRATPRFRVIRGPGRRMDEKARAQANAKHEIVDAAARVCEM